MVSNNSTSPIHRLHLPSILGPVGLRASEKKQNFDYS